jgi:hypothetical protein
MPRKIGFSTYQESFPGCDITGDEWEFMKAIAAYQKRWNRRYPSWREVLHVAVCLGYRKVAAPQPFEDPTDGEINLVNAAKKNEPPPDDPPD